MSFAAGTTNIKKSPTKENEKDHKSSEMQYLFYDLQQNMLSIRRKSFLVVDDQNTRAMEAKLLKLTQVKATNELSKKKHTRLFDYCN